MSPNTRIFLNIVATYGRSLYCVVCGLFTSRWVLMSLGSVDYGLYGVVGGLAAFIAFFNNILASSIGRYFAVSIGNASSASTLTDGLVECRKWFSVALVIHLTVPVVLLLVGYPLGIWTIRHYLTIPHDRLIDCLWVFRFVCVSCFVGMINVPFQAMYVARQHIAELTVYTVVSTTANVCFLYFMVTHPGDWLSRYACWTCFVSIIPQLIICIRACIVFPECRFSTNGLWRWSSFKNVLSYAGWQGVCSLGGLMRSQGIAILVNKFFGPVANASMAIAHSANGQASTLSASVLGAFSPAIANAYGAGKMTLVRTYVYRASKFALVSSMALLVPLALEIDEVFRLWLGSPPKMAAGITLLLMCGVVAEFATLPHVSAINATGEVAWAKAVYGLLLVATLPVCGIFVRLGFGLYSIGATSSVFMILAGMSSVLFAQRQNGISVSYWLRRVVMTTGLSAMMSSALALFVQCWFVQSFIRIVLTSISFELAFVLMVWLIVLNRDERDFLKVHLLFLKKDRVPHTNE